jgi:mannose-6-phosphate isomerase-like protein (cupin superfamily)
MRLSSFLSFASFSVTLALYIPATAQTQKIDDYSAAKLMQDAQTLRSKIDPVTGSFGQTLEKYPNHLTMLILRAKDGQSELHERIADVFFVVDGSATLWTGGRMIDAKTTGAGELRGSGLEGGSATVLTKGDIVHIPANVTHQLRIASGKEFTYFVVKVTEK